MSEPPHKIEILPGQDYAAQFPKTEPEDLPPGCILPEELHSIPTLPPTDVELPKECTWIVEPPIPEPYICEPSFRGGFDITVCPQAAANDVSITGDVYLTADPAAECGYVLDGGFEFCMPCIPTVEGGITFDTCAIDGKNITQVNTVTPIQIVYNAEECKYALEGEIQICTPCIPTITGEITISEGSTNDEDHPNFTDVTVIQPIKIIYDKETCSYTLGGEVTIATPKPCTSAVAIYPTQVTFNGPISGTLTMGIDSPTNCTNGVITQTITPELELTVEPGPCEAVDVQVFTGDATPLTLELNVDLGGVSLAPIQWDVALKLEVEPCYTAGCTGEWVPNDGHGTPSYIPGCCCFKLKVIPTETKLSQTLSIGYTTLDVCDAEGHTTTIRVLIPPTA